jgi:hypothetical protein
MLCHSPLSASVATAPARLTTVVEIDVDGFLQVTRAHALSRHSVPDAVDTHQA